MKKLKRIAFNLIPHIDAFMEDGFTKEEWKMVAETKKILDPKIRLVATCVRVPVFIGHSVPSPSSSRTRSPLRRHGAAAQCAGLPGDRQARGWRCATPYEAAGEDATYISRIREDPTVENGLMLWCGVSDNLRKGAALNAIQIAECLINRKLIQAKRKAA